MGSPFQTCWDRVDRAEVHRQALINLWNAFDTNEIYSSRPEVNSDGTGKFFLEPVKPEWVLPFSFEFGEMLYQLRGALDSCVYDAAILKFGSNPPPDENKWQFVVTDNPGDFKEAMRRMKKIPSDVASLMESMQSYAGTTCRFEGQEFDLGNTLAILNNWARIDRHRKLHLVGSVITSGNLRIGSPVGMGVEYCNFLGGDVIESQHEIASFKIRNFVPGAKISFEPKFAFEIMVDETPRVRLQEIALAMGVGVCAVRERFEALFGITR